MAGPPDADLVLDLARRTAAKVMVDLGVLPDLGVALACVDEGLVSAIAQLLRGAPAAPVDVVGAQETRH